MVNYKMILYMIFLHVILNLCDCDVDQTIFDMFNKHFVMCVMDILICLINIYKHYVY